MTVLFGIKQALWLSQLLKDIRFFKYIGSSLWTMQLFGDNIGFLDLVKNPCLYKQSKYINVAHHFIQNLQRRRQLQIIYILSEDMIADRLTKPLPIWDFEAFIK